MLKFNQKIGSEGMLNLIRRTCNRIDPRLMDHGLRVSYIVSKLLKNYEGYKGKTARDICFLALLHDIGAYKTEEIDHMVEFETVEVWDHSIYGYLFLKYFSPLDELAPVILFHHTRPGEIKQFENWISVDYEIEMLAQMFYLADRTDIYLAQNGEGWDSFLNRLNYLSGKLFSKEAVAAMRKLKPLTLDLETIESDPEYLEMINAVPLTIDEINAYLKMLVCSIDFRSRHTVSHTITTTSISSELAILSGLSEEDIQTVVNGAMLHDLGKIGVPVEILEYPGKLSPQAMSVMRTHVDITREIIEEYISEVVVKIAIRHHEKLDGSGYPLGLVGSQMNKMERIVAVADIVSALSGTRSYKDAFSKEKTLGIIQKMGGDGGLDLDVVQAVIDHYDDIMEITQVRCTPVVDTYNRIQEEYNKLKGIVYKVKQTTEREADIDIRSNEIQSMDRSV